MAWTELDNDPPGHFCEHCGELMTWDCLDYVFYTCENSSCEGEAA